MSLKEATRSADLDRVVKGEMTAAEGAARLGMSRRQIFRLKAKILTWGIFSLSHGNRNRRPPNALPEETRSMVCAKAAGEYRGASLNHMSELLERIDGMPEEILKRPRRRIFSPYSGALFDSFRRRDGSSRV